MLYTAVKNERCEKMSTRIKEWFDVNKTIRRRIRAGLVSVMLTNILIIFDGRLYFKGTQGLDSIELM